MNEEVKKLIAAERKRQRDIKELQDLKEKMKKQKAPDQKMLHQIETELNNLHGENK